MCHGVVMQGLNAKLKCKYNNDKSYRQNRVFHVKLMFLHKPLFILKNEEQSLRHVRTFITLEGKGRRVCSSLAGYSCKLHSD